MVVLIRRCKPGDGPVPAAASNTTNTRKYIPARDQDLPGTRTHAAQISCRDNWVMLQSKTYSYNYLLFLVPNEHFPDQKHKIIKISIFRNILPLAASEQKEWSNVSLFENFTKSGSFSPN